MPTKWTGEGWDRVTTPIRTLVRKMTARTFVERMGYAPDAKLLIVHADDLGLSRPVNEAFIEGYKAGFIPSGSAMVPCPSFPDVVAFAKAHPDADIGLHLTLTSGPASHRWKSVAPPKDVPSLVDDQGHFHRTWTRETQIDPRDVEVELRAQIEKALADGLRPTHLDSHLFLLQSKGKKIFDAYLKVARDYRVPGLIPRSWFSGFPYLRTSLAKRDVAVDAMVTIGARVPAEGWTAFYLEALDALTPGITAFVIHPGFDNQELQDFYQGQLPWGSAWRQRDYDFFASKDFSNSLRRNRIALCTWREIGARLFKADPAKY